MIHLIRHGETEWSRDGRHTGRTDLPLTAAGERSALALGAALHGRTFARVWTSPLQRARWTCQLAGFGARAVQDDALREWDYGDYEGLTTPAIRGIRPDWNLFLHGAPGGESIEAVRSRAEAFLARCGHGDGDVLVFSSSHLLRLLTTVWLRRDPVFAEHLPLGTGSWSILDEEPRHDARTIGLWNHRPQAP